jgi:transposase InsO family protein
VTDDGTYRDDEWAITLALFRYGVIAELVELTEPGRGEVGEKVKEIAGRRHYLPGRGPVTVSERTVYSWARLYRHGGLDALRPRWRADRGCSRKLSPGVLERAARLRRENPRRSTTTVMDILEREGTLTGQSPHRATFDRHLDRLGASRRQLLVIASKPTRKMEFSAFGDLWVGDYHHGPVILGPDGKPTTAKLGAFIDHCTRYPVADRYYLAEDLPTLRDTMLRALLTWGPPGKAYVDRGSVYRSDQLAYSLLRVGTKLVHSKAYYSQGRGAIEVWWQVAQAFESEVAMQTELITVHELNRLWTAYRELRYCQAVHSSLGISPNEAVAEVTPKPIAPDVARELFLIGVDRTVDRKDACVAVEGRRFQCQGWLRRRKVRVRFDPSNLSSVVIFHNGERVQRAFPQVPNVAPEPGYEPPVPPPASVDYLALLREDYDRQLLQHAKPLAYAKLQVDPGFDAAAFTQVVTNLAGIKSSPASTREIHAFWETFGPLPEALVRIAVEHAVRLNTRGRHPRVYLHAIQTLLLAHWRSRPDHNDDKESP